MNSGFSRGVNGICPLTGFYAGSNDIFLPTFRYNIMAPSSGFKHSSWNARILKIGPTGCPKTSVRIYRSTWRKIPEQPRSHLKCYYIITIYILIKDGLKSNWYIQRVSIAVAVPISLIVRYMKYITGHYKYPHWVG